MEKGGTPKGIPPSLSERASTRPFDQAGTRQAPTFSYPGGAWPSMYQGSQSWPGSSAVHSSSEVGDIESQTCVQQPPPAHAVNAPAPTQMKPSSQALMNSHGSPYAPALSPDASGAQAHESLIG